MDQDLVLFLGAGFSFDAGLPIMSQFGDKSLSDFDTLKTHADPNLGMERLAAPLLVEAGERFQAFQRLCVKSPTLTSTAVNNLETVYCIAEALHEAGVQTVELDGSTVALEDVLVAIRLWIWKIYQQCPLRNPTRDTNPKTYDRFFGTIKKHGVADRLTVVTTNYDLIYEYLSCFHGLQCCYPFDELSPAYAELQVGSGTSSFVLRDQSGGRDRAVVCKLHGSVNYFEDRSESVQPKLFVSTNLGDKRPIGKSHNYNCVPAIFAVDAIWDIRDRYGERMVPAIVPPTYAKLTSEPWLVAIWDVARQAISEAKRIVFVGYSLPDSDGFIRALFHGALALRRGVGAPEVVVIDPSADVHNRYRQLFGSMYRDVGTHTLADCPTEELERILS